VDAEDSLLSSVCGVRVGALCVTVIVAIGCGAPPSPLTSSKQTGSSPPKTPTPVGITSPRSGPPLFRDVTAESGLNFTYRNGEEADHFSILESLGGGVGLIDFDRDGLLDVFVVGGGYYDGPDKREIRGYPCRLYRNLGNWRFADVSAEVGLGEVDWWYTHGVAIADYDRDGWPDIAVSGFGRLALFRNEMDREGARRFKDVAADVRLQDDSWSTSIGWGDLDGDGFPDLYASHYVNWSFENHIPCPGILEGKAREICSPGFFKPLIHALFHNDQGQKFRNDAEKHGFTPTGAGLGVLLADLNDDAQPDVFATNDMTPNFLFFNRGGELEERAALAGVAVDEEGKPNGNMGVDAGDYDHSGRASIWVTVYQNETHVLARNLGREFFQHQSRASGIATIGRHFVSFGTGFIDVDNDGWEDIFIASGHVFRFPPGSEPRQRPVLFSNSEQPGRRFFKDVGAQAGPYFESRQLGRGAAIGDIDNDGWSDLIVSHTNSPVVLLRNEAAAGQAKPRHWLGLQLVGRDHRDVVGSTVIVESQGQKLTRFTKGGGSYCSSGDRRLLFGLGESDSIERVTVKWSWGETQTWGKLAVGQYWELKEGETEAANLERH
jgi:enediyne biosynthesis protein E4